LHGNILSQSIPDFGFQISKFPHLPPSDDVEPGVVGWQIRNPKSSVDYFLHSATKSTGQRERPHRFRPGRASPPGPPPRTHGRTPAAGPGSTTPPAPRGLVAPSDGSRRKRRRTPPLREDCRPPERPAGSGNVPMAIYASPPSRSSRRCLSSSISWSFNVPASAKSDTTGTCEVWSTWRAKSRTIRARPEARETEAV